MQGTSDTYGHELEQEPQVWDEKQTRNTGREKEDGHQVQDGLQNAGNTPRSHATDPLLTQKSTWPIPNQTHTQNFQHQGTLNSPSLSFSPRSLPGSFLPWYLIYHQEFYSLQECPSS